MKRGFVPMRRRGEHWNMVRHAVRGLQRTPFYPKSQSERNLEHAMVTSLQQMPQIQRHLVTQLDNDPIDKVQHAKLLGFRHRPDAAIGRDSTAFELKSVRGAAALRSAIGQALTYRVGYRFVVLCLVDRTPDYQLLRYAEDPNRPGHHLLKGLAEDLGIFTVIAPRRTSRNQFNNLAFIA